MSIGYATTLLGVFGALLNNLWLLAAVAIEVDQDELGLYLLAAATIGYFALAQLGLGPASAQHIAEELGQNNPEQATRIYYQLRFFNLCVCAGIVLLSCLALVLVPYMVGEDLQKVTFWIIAATGVGTAVKMLANPARAALNGASDVHIVGAVTLVSNLVTPFIAYALLKMGWGVLCLPLSLCITETVSLFVLHYQRAKSCPWSSKHVTDRWRGFRSLFAFGIGISGSIALAMVVATCEPVIFKLASENALSYVASYHIWMRFPAMTFVLSSGITNNSGPALATKYARDKDEGTEFFHRIFWMATVVGGACAFAIAAWLNPFVHHWLSGKYDSPNGLSIAFGFGVLTGLRALLHATASVFFPLHQIRNASSGYAVQAGTKLLLGITLVYFFSIPGMVWAYALSTLLSILFLMRILVRQEFVSFKTALASVILIGTASSLGAILSMFTKTAGLTTMIFGITITAIVLLLLILAIYRLFAKLSGNAAPSAQTC